MSPFSGLLRGAGGWSDKKQPQEKQTSPPEASAFPRLQSLTFGRFNQPLQLPHSLQSLAFEAFDRQLPPLPASLTALTLGDSFDRSLQGAFEVPGCSLLSLSMGSRFNQSLEDVVLPETLQHLVFGDNFDQSLELVRLPKNLRSLTFGRFFNQSLDRVAFPESLQSLTLARTFTRSLEQMSCTGWVLQTNP